MDRHRNQCPFFRHWVFKIIGEIARSPVKSCMKMPTPKQTVIFPVDPINFKATKNTILYLFNYFYPFFGNSNLSVCVCVIHR